MKHYIDITLLADAEVPLNFLWEKVYKQLHLCLVNLQSQHNNFGVAVAFPEYNIDEHKLGSKLRLLADANATLEQLNIKPWLSQLSDYIHITRTREVPDTIQQHAIFKRIQTKNSNTRLARRKARRQGISYDHALEQIGKRKESWNAAPFIRMKSQSSTHRFNLMIDCIKADAALESAHFSSYGLSSTNSVPIF